MRRIILAEFLILCAVFAASVAFILWRIPTDQLDETRIAGRVVAADCGNHGRVSYEFQYLGRSYLQDGNGIDCPSLRVGQTLSVWVERGHPDWASLTARQPGPHAAIQRTAYLILIFFLVVGTGVLRLLPRVFPGGRLGRGPWQIGNWPWPNS